MSDTADTAIRSDVAENEDIAGLVRRGPGTIEGLRFKWTVRAVGSGYFVDETVGASQSAVSRGPMSREIALDYIEARYRDASARFEHRRDRLANAPLRPKKPPTPPAPPPAPPPPPSPPVAEVQPETDVVAAEPAMDVAPAPPSTPSAQWPGEVAAPTPPPAAAVQTGLAQAMLAAAAKSDSSKSRPDDKRVDLEDVMNRITRLLDER